MHMNAVLLAGFLGRDAFRDSGDNGNFTILELVIVLSYDDKESKENVLRVESHDLIVFGGCGEEAARCKKGDFVIVTGELRHTDDESKKTDCKQPSYTIRVTRVRRINRDPIAALEAFLDEPDVEEPEKLETE